MNQPPLDGAEIRLLTELGFLAAGAGQLDRAEDIFRALVHLRPRRAFGYVGWAMAYMNTGRLQEAVSVLDRAKLAMKDNTDIAETVEVEAFRGLALQLRDEDGDRDHAEAHFTRALELRPEWSNMEARLRSVRATAGARAQGPAEHLRLGASDGGRLPLTREPGETW